MQTTQLCKCVGDSQSAHVVMSSGIWVGATALIWAFLLLRVHMGVCLALNGRVAAVCMCGKERTETAAGRQVGGDSF